MSTKFAHRLGVNLLFNAVVPPIDQQPNVGNEIPYAGGATQFKGLDQSPAQSTWRLYKHPATRWARSLGGGGGHVRIRLETTHTEQRFGGEFFGVNLGYGPWGVGSDAARIASRNPNTFAPYEDRPQWPQNKLYIPCSEVKCISGWYAEYEFGENSEVIFTGRRASIQGCTVSTAGAFTVTYQSNVLFGPNWVPEDDGYVKYRDVSDDEFQSSDMWYKEIGSDITAASITGNDVFPLQPVGLYAYCRDAEIDTSYTYNFTKNHPRKDAHNPEKGTGSPYNFDKQTCAGRVVMELSIPCPEDLCWIEGAVYNVTISYENFTCKIGNSRASSYYNDYDYTSTGTGSETFSYTIPSNATSGDVEIGTFSWNLSPNQARKVTDVKLTSLTNA